MTTESTVPLGNQHKGLTGLPYFGGKSCLNHGLGPWINSLLPTERQVLYMEPFFGMGGILLARPPSFVELVNDINDRVVNWWRVVRDKADEIGYLSERTPYARKEYEWALANLDNPEYSDVQRALAFTVVLLQGLIRGDGAVHASWARHFEPTRATLMRYWDTETFKRLQDRMRAVQIDNCDAVELLERVATVDRAIIYCDPPYKDARTTVYHKNEVDRDRLTNALLALQGSCAISGYGDEWDHLGWRREEFQTIRSNITSGKNRTGQRTEVLWMNYNIKQMRLI